MGNETTNGALTYPVGLLTSDEVMLAGGKLSYGSSNYYLFMGKNYWLLTPYIVSYPYAYNNSREFIVSFLGDIGSDRVGNNANNNLGVHPSISFKPGTMLGVGTGEPDSPLKILE